MAVLNVVLEQSWQDENGRFYVVTAVNLKAEAQTV
jgi:hypothetical protein